ncbi:MAG: hypothetical protein LKG19_04755 [Saprospiraceae bacterium]|jgi:hypothetical protein|nr:hypothetical protein [Saprospiraceae bacterium]
MLPKKKLLGFLICIGVLLIVSCYKDKTVYFDTGAEITRPVSFANDIIPIFNGSCNVSGCHNSGGQKPNLTESRAFSSLTDGNYLNPSSPENSVIYLWMSGKKSTPMPVGGINKDYNALILAWIKQGTLNN